MANAVVVDLDAAKQVRQAKTKTPRVVLEGKTFNLPKELPLGVFAQIKKIREDTDNKESKADESLDAMDGILDEFFGDQKEAFMQAHPTLDDLLELITQVVEKVYGVDVGEA